MSPSNENERLAHPEFWDARYSNAPEGEDAPTHEWFRTYQDLEAFFQNHLVKWRAPETNPRIVHLGSGDSTIPQDLAKLGYSNQLCVDFSQVVVEKMAKRDANTTGIEWRQLDARSMENSIDSGAVDVAFDKGTLDAMIHGSPWNPPDDVKDNTGKYIREVFRILKDDGVFLYVTYRQPHFIRPLLNCEGTSWDIDVEVLGSGESSFAYHGFILRKASSS